MKKVLIIGAGGREHALARAFAKSPQVEQVIVAPGNPGMVEEGIEIVDIKVDQVEALREFAQAEGIDLSFVGAEIPLEAGVVDHFMEFDLPIVGPTKEAAQLETSKDYAKQVMAQAGVKTAKHHYFEPNKITQAKAYMKELGLPFVIKADGLMAGKGVVIPQSMEEAIEAVDNMMVDQKVPVLIEEFLEGKEFSYFTFVNGTDIIPVGSACDYKRVGEGDVGLNTGGMGAFGPVSWVDKALETEVLETVVRPLAKQMVDNGTPFTGILYSGLMLTDEGPKVIEFNTRFGDPETQIILPRIQTDFYELVQAHLNKTPIEIKLNNQIGLGVILAAEGYPQANKTGMKIELPETIQKDQVFYAGVSLNEKEELVASGGRILMVTTFADSIEEARNSLYPQLEKIKIPHTFYRRDIGLHRD